MYMCVWALKSGGCRIPFQVVNYDLEMVGPRYWSIDKLGVLLYQCQQTDMLSYRIGRSWISHFGTLHC